MRTTQQLSITLPRQMAEMVEAKVRSGDYASTSEVIRDGLRALAERDGVVEAWLREEIPRRLDAYDRDPSTGRTIEQVRATLADQLAKRR
jgi:putative addiction module CopG family antidote